MFNIDVVTERHKGIDGDTQFPPWFESPVSGHYIIITIMSNNNMID